MKVAFIGLGVMGFPMAGHLSQAGHEVTVYNRTTAKSEAWTQDYKGSYALVTLRWQQKALILFSPVLVMMTIYALLLLAKRGF